MIGLDPADEISGPTPDFQSALARLWQASQASFRERVDTCEEYVASLLLGEPDQAVREAAMVAAHKLAGTMGLFGMATGSKLAKDLEHRIEDRQDHDHRDRERMAEIVNRLRGMVETQSGAVWSGGDQKASQTSPATQTLRVGLTGSATAYIESLRGAGTLRGVVFEELTSNTSRGAFDVVVISSRGVDDLAATVVAATTGGPPVVVVVESARVADRAELLRCGASGLITPGTDPETVLTLLESLVHHGEQGFSAVAIAIDDQHHEAMVRGFSRERCDVYPTTGVDDLTGILEVGVPDVFLVGDDLDGAGLLDVLSVVMADPLWSSGSVVALPADETEAAHIASEALARGADDVVAMTTGWAAIARRLKPLVRPPAQPTDGRLLAMRDRRRLRGRIQARLDECSDDAPVSILYVRVQGLDVLNADQGFEAGDAALLQVERFLRASFGSSDLVGPWVGDGLVVVLGADRDAGALRLGEVLSDLETAGLSCVGGVAVAPVDGDRADALVSLAKARAPGPGGRDRPRPGRPLEHLVDGAGTVVVVEDDHVVSELVRELLEFQGYDVTVIGDGPTAISLLAEPTVDQGVSLVLLDITLPGVDGFGVLRAMQQTKVLDRIPVVMLTARSQADQVAAAMSLGAVDHIAKPFSPELLSRRVERALSLSVRQ